LFITKPTSLALLCLLLAHAAAAAPPDLSGYWLIPFSPLPPNREATPLERSLIELLDDDALLLADSGLKEFPPGDYGGLAVRPELVAAARNYDPEVQRAVSTTCLPPSIVYAMQGPFPIEIFQGTELVVIKMEYFDLVRIIFMHETEHPENWPHSAVGHSIGRWEGEDLVVDTRFLKAATLFNNGVDHSQSLHLVERFRLSEDRNTLAVTQEFEDPEVFDGKAARIMPFARGTDHVYPYDCDPSYGAAVENRERVP
jgi:hypothetical protein